MCPASLALPSLPGFYPFHDLFQSRYVPDVGVWVAVRDVQVVHPDRYDFMIEWARPLSVRDATNRHNRLSDTGRRNTVLLEIAGTVLYQS